MRVARAVLVGRSGRRPVLLVVRATASVAAMAGLILVVVPLVSGAPWARVGAALAGVPPVDLLALTVLWASGLLAHTVTLTAALPRLTHRRALTLSLTGSAVANVLPFGGAAGIGLNYRMSRAWGFDRGSFAVYTLVTNVWDVLVKLSLPAVALGWLVLSGDVGAGRILGTAAVTTGALAGVSLLGVATIASARTTLAVGTALDRVVQAARRLAGSDREDRVGDTLLRLREESAALVRRAWPRLTAGVVAYAMLTAVLLWACLHFTGAGLPPAAIFAGFALERVLTLAGLTPGGAGLVEVGLSGLLIALGGDPVGSVTGVLLYRAFTYGLEIPVGGAGLAGWLWARRRALRAPVAEVAP